MRKIEDICGLFVYLGFKYIHMGTAKRKVRIVRKHTREIAQWLEKLVNLSKHSWNSWNKPQITITRGELAIVREQAATDGH